MATAASADARADEAGDVFFDDDSGDVFFDDDCTDGDACWDGDVFFDASDCFPSTTIPVGSSSASSPPSTLRRRRRRPLSCSAAAENSAASAVTTDELLLPVPDTSEDATSVRPPAMNAPPLSPFLETLLGLVIRAVLFQFNFFISVITLPILITRYAFMVVTDPLGVVKHARAVLTSKILDCGKTLVEKAGSFLPDMLGGGLGVGGMLIRIMLGLFWALYVCTVLLSLLIMAFWGARVFTRAVVKQPLQITESLRFDYTKPTPLAVVPIDWMMTPKQKLHATVSLTLPESDYNRRLGVFQVRAEFLSANGRVLASSSQPCMLRFKSLQLHFIETFLKSVALLSGYSSESQVIKVKMKVFTEGSEPSKFVKISLEQRAEFHKGAGIPEIYEASLNVESEVSLLRRVIWHWRRTIFVWISMILFVSQLLFTLLCCRPLVMPRSRRATGR